MSKSDVIEVEGTVVEKLPNATFKVELENISNDTKQKLKSSMSDLASDIVEKVIGYRSDVQGFDDNVVNEVLWESK